MVNMNRQIDVSASAPGDWVLRFGWDQASNHGISSDLVVDQVNGSDDNTGFSASAAKATIGAALAAAAPGARIRVRSGVYREQLTPGSGVSGADRTELLAYGTERPVVTGGESLTGFVACTSGDASRVGSNWGSMFKYVGLMKSAIADGNPRALNIHEAGEMLNLCADWSGGGDDDKFFLESVPDWHTADITHVDGSDLITGYTDTSVTSAYSQAQIENAVVKGHTEPNVNFSSEVASFNTSTGEITLADAGVHDYEDNVNRDRWCLINILPAMQQGEWGWWDNGDGTVDVYVWPSDSANIASGIEYSAREHCLVLNGVSHFRTEGIEYRQSAGVSGNAGSAIIASDVTVRKQNLAVVDCKIDGIVTSRKSSVWIGGCDNVNVDQNTMRKMQNSFGIFIQGYVRVPLADTLPCLNVSVQFNDIYRSEDSGLRFYTIRYGVSAFNRVVECGLSAHANKMNFYEQCSLVMGWGNRFIRCGGYATYQETSAIAWIMNSIPATDDSTANTSRAIEDQQNGTLPPNSYNGDTQLSYLLCNAFLPDPVAIGGTAQNGMGVTSHLAGGASVDWVVKNNLYHGHNVKDAARVHDWGGNWNTGPDGAYNIRDTATAPESVWVDPANDNFAIGAASPIRSAATESIVAEIAALQSELGHLFDKWDRDAAGRLFDAASPPVGCVADYEYGEVLAA